MKEEKKLIQKDGAWIKSERLRLGIERSEIATFLGVTETTVWRWEDRHFSIRRLYIRLLSDYFGGKEVGSWRVR